MKLEKKDITNKCLIPKVVMPETIRKNIISMSNFILLIYEKNILTVSVTHKNKIKLSKLMEKQVIIGNKRTKLLVTVSHNTIKSVSFEIRYCIER